MKLNKGIHIQLNDLEGDVFGGKFKDFMPGTRRLVGIKMAEEINHPHDFAVDTEDFSVPSPEAMVEGLLFSLQAMSRGSDTYVGCMGGIGRTGLFMGCMTKVMFDYTGAKSDPVFHVREHYYAHAIETDEQQDFVRGFNTQPVLEWLEDRQLVFTSPAPLPEVPEAPERVVFLGPFDWAMHAWVTPMLKCFSIK